MGITYNGVEVTSVNFIQGDAAPVSVNDLRFDGQQAWAYAPDRASIYPYAFDDEVINIHYNVSNNQGDAITGYTHEYSIDQNFTNVETVQQTTSSTIGKITFNGLQPNTTYYFRTKALGQYGGNFSDVKSATTAPAVPTLIAEPWSATQVKLSWNQVAGATHYFVQVKEQGTSTWNNLHIDGTQNLPTTTGIVDLDEEQDNPQTAILSNISEATHEVPDPSKTYDYRIKSYNNTLPYHIFYSSDYPAQYPYSRWVTTVSATVGSVPTAPAAPSASFSGAGGVYTDLTLSWVAVTGADEYEISRYNYDTEQYELHSTTTDTSKTIEDLPFGSHDKWKIRAIRALDGGDLASGWSSERDTFSQLAQPTNLTVTSVTGNRFTVSWAEGANRFSTGTNHSDIMIAYGPLNYLFEWFAATGPINSTTRLGYVTTSNLSAETTTTLDFATNYRWRVRTNAAGQFPASGMNLQDGVVTTLSGAMDSPQVYYNNTTDRGVRIKWLPITGASSYTVSNSIQNYTYDGSQDSQGYLYVDINNLTGSTSYTFTVTANAGAGYSGNTSGSTTFTTLNHNITVPGSGSISVTETSFTVRINQPNLQYRAGGIIGPFSNASFNIDIRNSSGSQVHNQNVANPTDTYPLDVEFNSGLTHNSSYTVTVYAYNPSNPSQKSGDNVTTVTTTQTQLPTITTSSATSTPFTVSLNWGGVANASGYNVRVEKYQGALDDHEANSSYDPWTLLQTTSNGLTYGGSGGINPNATYKYQIQPIDETGTEQNRYADGVWSDIFQVTSDKQTLATPDVSLLSGTSGVLVVKFDSKTEESRNC